MEKELTLLKRLQDVEALRTEYAKQKNVKDFLRTYNTHQSIILNGNSGKFWDEIFSHTPEEVNHVELDRNKTAVRWLDEIVKSKMRILNVGCGDGKFERLLHKFPAGVKYIGIDFATKSINILRNKFPEFHFIAGNITKMNFPKQLNLICVFEVMEHITDKLALNVLKIFWKALTPDGMLMLAVPLNEPLLKMYPSNPNEHVRMYSKQSICMELEICGFEIVRVEEFFAFRSSYYLKKLLSKTFLKSKWKANDILILARKIT